MKIGKVSESVLKRSVLKQIKTKREEITKSAGVGSDCAFFESCDALPVAFSTDPVILNEIEGEPLESSISRGIITTLNDIAAGGAKAAGILLTLLLPEQAEEKMLQQIMKQVEQTCSKQQIQLMGGHTEVTDTVTTPILCFTGVGQSYTAWGSKVQPGQEVVMSKWIGLEGTAILARAKEQELTTRYPLPFIRQAASFDRYLSVEPEAATAVKSNVCAMHDVRRGGIYGALWELAASAGVGLIIDLKKIPIKQETIEICEFYDLNPYELLSGGALLMTTDNAKNLIRALEEQGIEATVIGRTTADNDKLILNEEETRYLEPPRTDEIYKITNRKEIK